MVSKDFKGFQEISEDSEVFKNILRNFEAFQMMKSVILLFTLYIFLFNYYSINTFLKTSFINLKIL